MPLTLHGQNATAPGSLAMRTECTSSASPSRARRASSASGSFPARIEQDRAYVHALRDADVLSDPRVGPSPTFGRDWLHGVHERQLQHLARRRERDGTPG
jgi:hypothetical protein